MAAHGPAATPFATVRPVWSGLLPRLFSRLLLLTACFVLVNAVADARTQNVPSSIDDLLQQVTTPALGERRALLDSDVAGLKSALAAARSGDRGRFNAAFSSISDPIARKIATWAMIDAAGEQLSFFELDQARRDLADWPRATRRQTLAERMIETGGLAPDGVIEWFGGRKPSSAYGAMALAAAYQAAGRESEARALIHEFWVGEVFEAEPQRTMLARFGSMLTPEDHAVRADMLLYGQQGPATRDMLALLNPDQRAVAEARMAARAGGGSAQIARLPEALQGHPGVAYERISAYRRAGQTDAALSLVERFPPAPGYADADTRLWTERRQLINAALRKQDYRAAYAAATNHGLTAPVDLTEAEFYAGWLALSKLNDPSAADAHFARIQAAGSSPITQGRALYWRGRAHEAMGDAAGAQTFYAQGGRHYTTFYGQLAAEKAGLGPIDLGSDPQITDADRARFEGRDVVQAARVLAEAGERDLFRAFVMHIDDALPSAQEYALLVDMARSYREQELSMLVVRAGAQKGFILPDRGYPLRVPPPSSSAELAFIFGITRQESGFDPMVRSEANARGMMQLIPPTAQTVARQVGVPYNLASLYDADYNMRLGAYHLGDLVDRFNGSYLLAAAGYNAGPGRPTEWMAFCGDPRGGTTDPLDFIECIPFSETRNYVMRVLEGMQVYRARLNNGATTPTLAMDLKRGGYVYAPPPQSASN